MGDNENVQHSKVICPTSLTKVSRTSLHINSVRKNELNQVFLGYIQTNLELISLSSWYKMPKIPTIPATEVDKTMKKECQSNSGSYLHHPGEFWQTWNRWEDSIPPRWLIPDICFRREIKLLLSSWASSLICLFFSRFSHARRRCSEVSKYTQRDWEELALSEPFVKGLQLKPVALYTSDPFSPPTQSFS